MRSDRGMKVKTTIEFCCKFMRANFGDYPNGKKAPYQLVNGLVAQVSTSDDGNVGYHFIDYCQWCGEKIEFEVI